MSKENKKIAIIAAVLILLFVFKDKIKELMEKSGKRKLIPEIPSVKKSINTGKVKTVFIPFINSGGGIGEPVNLGLPVTTKKPGPIYKVDDSAKGTYKGPTSSTGTTSSPNYQKATEVVKDSANPEYYKQNVI